jgi:hypothetical protein
MNSANPWFQIWIRPRETIRAYLNSADPGRGIIWLALAAGYLNGLDNASARNMGDKVTSMVHIYGGYAFGGVLGGLLTLFLGSWLLKVTGQWLGGQGTTPEVRVAIARGFFMPSILVGVLWIPQLLLFGSEMFTAETPVIDADPGLTALFYILMVIEFVLIVWMIVVGLKSVGEAHRFSAWRALAIVLISFVILLFALIGIATVMSVIISAM